MMKIRRNILLLILSVLLVSCADDNYVDTIPADCVALFSIDWQQSENTGREKFESQLLQKLFQVEGLDDLGLNLREKVYLFETSDGVFGLCAKVDSRKKLVRLFEEKLLSSNRCKKLSERRGHSFTILDDNWAIGFSDDALLVMGPVISGSAEQAQLLQRMGKYLDADGNNGIRSTEIYERLSALTAPVCMTVQAAALPESVAIPLTIGAPKEADALQLWLSAAIKNTEGCLEIAGNVFSFSKKIDDALKVSHDALRPITERFVDKMSKNALFGLFMNSEGAALLSMFQSNKGIQMLLAGMNTAIDMDNILRSVDGNMAVIVPGFEREKPQIGILAELKHTDWMKDIDYWKRSCPMGTAIRDKGKNAFLLDLDVANEGTNVFPFGVTDDQVFYGGRFLQGTDTADGVPMVKDLLPSDVRSAAVGKKISIVLAMEALQTQMSAEAFDILKSVMRTLFGEVTTIIYTMR